MERYHKDLGFPAHIEIPQGLFKLDITGHARKAAQTDRYGSFQLDTWLDTYSAEAIEIEEESDGLKVVYRMHHSRQLDVCYAVLFAGNKAVLKTAWLNEKSDQHKTLKFGHYTQVGA